MPGKLWLCLVLNLRVFPHFPHKPHFSRAYDSTTEICFRMKLGIPNFSWSGYNRVKQRQKFALSLPRLALWISGFKKQNTFRCLCHFFILQKALPFWHFLKYNKKDKLETWWVISVSREGWRGAELLAASPPSKIQAKSSGYWSSLLQNGIYFEPRAFIEWEQNI